MHDIERLGQPGAVRGRVGERPWAALLAALGRNGYSGQVTVRAAAGKVHAIAFADGVIVGARSPVAADGVARIAFAMRLVAPGQLPPPASGRERQGGVRDRDLDAYLTTTQLAPAQVQRLKHRIVLQRAARTFAIETGEYTLDRNVTIPVMLGVRVDVGAVVYEGVRLHLDGERLVTALAPLGTWFTLTAHGDAELARFELSEAEQPVLAALRDGTCAADLEARQRELDPRLVQAVIYALATCGALERMATNARGTRARLREPPALTRARGSSGLAPLVPPEVPVVEARPPRVTTPTDQAACVPMLIRIDPEIPVPSPPIVPPKPPVRRAVERPARGVRSAPEGGRGSLERPARGVRSAPEGERGSIERPARAAPLRPPTEPFLEARPTTMRPNALSASQLRALIVRLGDRMDSAADHFAMLDVPIGASVEAVRVAYIELARNLRTERLVELGIRDPGFRARGVFAQICIAYTTLTDPVRRADYIGGLMRSASPRVVDLDFTLLAAEAFERGARALRGDDPELAVAELRTACELAPNDIAYLATLGHAEFCASSAKTRD